MINAIAPNYGLGFTDFVDGRVATKTKRADNDTFDQGSQFTSISWASLLKQHNLEHSISRRGNCHDNAVAESFFNLLKRERIRRKTYRTRAEARRIRLH